ncbi:MAG: hypothetical protein WAM82_02015, partial [Thermoanaerobaculia bacterium]
SRDRSVETPQTRYETLGRLWGRRGVSDAAMSVPSSPPAAGANPQTRDVWNGMGLDLGPSGLWT